MLSTLPTTSSERPFSGLFLLAMIYSRSRLHTARSHGLLDFSSAGITVGSLLGILIARWRCYANCKDPELRGIPKYTNETSGDINTNHHLLSNIEPLIAAPQ